MITHSALRTAKGFTLLELLVTVTIISVLAAILLPALSRAREAGRRATCQANLMGIGVALRIYADEHGGLFPPMHGRDPFTAADAADGACVNAQPDTDFIFRTSAMVPEYLTDPAVLLCPSHPGLRDADAKELLGIIDTAPNAAEPCPWEGLISNGDASYLYFGYALDKVGRKSLHVDERLAGLPGIPAPGAPGWPGPSDRDDGVDGQLAALIDALRTAEGDHAALDGPLDASAFAERVGMAGRLGSGTGDTLLRLREGVDRLLIEDMDRPDLSRVSEASLPVCWDAVFGATPEQGAAFAHLPGGCNVLFMDGHVRFMRMGESGVLSAPAVRTAQALRALASESP